MPALAVALVQSGGRVVPDHQVLAEVVEVLQAVQRDEHTITQDQQISADVAEVLQAVQTGQRRAYPRLPQPEARTTRRQAQDTHYLVVWPTR